MKYLAIFALTASLSMHAQITEKLTLNTKKYSHKERRIGTVWYAGIDAIYKNQRVATAAYSYNLRLKTADLDYIKVEKQWQQQGVGSHIFQNIIKDLKQNNIKTLTWIAEPIDVSGKQKQLKARSELIKFYTKMGGVITDKSDPLEIKMKYTIK